MADELEPQILVFARDVTGMPTAAAYELNLAETPDEEAVLYRRAGLDSLAEHANIYHRARKAAERYEALSDDDYKIFERHLDSRTRSKDYVRPLPIGVTAALADAGEAAIFDSIDFLHDRASGEHLAIGTIAMPEGGDGDLHFLIVQWGIGRLHSVADFLEIEKANRPPLVRRALQSATFRLSGLMALTAATWLLLPLSWWWVALAGIVMSIVTILEGITVYINGTLREEPVANIAVVVGVINIIVVLVVGCVALWQWNTASNVSEVTVCAVFNRPNADGHHPDSSLNWGIGTPDGTMTLEPGTYNGTPYKTITAEVANQLAHKRVRITAHGHLSSDGGHPPYVTAATVIGDAADNACPR